MKEKSLATKKSHLLAYGDIIRALSCEMLLHTTSFPFAIKHRCNNITSLLYHSSIKDGVSSKFKDQYYQRTIKE